MSDLQYALVLMTTIAWPVIPIFWIPVHMFHRAFIRLGRVTYLFPLAVWMPLAITLYRHRDTLLSVTLDLPSPLNITGALLFVAGTLLHLWTASLLGLSSITGRPEIDRSIKNEVVRTGPFSVVRHPTYLAHTMMFAGVFLFSGNMAAAVVTLLDLIAVTLVIIPAEEKELEERFGEDYRRYMSEVPRLIPVKHKKKAGD
jgi:protein-S-isoprenylcysteine O-methyltransferase Ste14